MDKTHDDEAGAFYRQTDKDGYDIAREQIEKFAAYSNWNSFIVALRLKYDDEEEYTEEKQILSVEDDCFCWDTDWCEGQTDVIVDGIINVREIPLSVFSTEKGSLNRLPFSYWWHSTFAMMYSVKLVPASSALRFHSSLVPLGRFSATLS